MHSTEESINQLSPKHRKVLLDLASKSISNGLIEHKPLTVNPDEYPRPLQQERACFITLTLNDALRGCIGHLEAIQPLVADVAENAYAAAFRDPRFPPLAFEEMKCLTIHISVLTPAQPVTYASEANLIELMRPGIDGLILEEGLNRGTFLPSVWESLPEPRDFLNHLKQKAGLPMDYWSDGIKISRYETESFS